MLPLAPGIGTHSLPRYYFDVEASLCRSFTYSGFGGNDNNFETIQECRMACPGKSILKLIEFKIFRFKISNNNST